ncbi:MAG: hypothetical protein ACI85O_003781 [Saprospiraceae bacterium]|jgi:hypothetical protein
MRVLFFLCILLLNSAIGKGQGSVLISEGLNFEILDRLEVKMGITPTYFSNLRPINRGDVVNFALRLDTTLTDISERTRYDLDYIFKDNNEWLMPSEFPTTLAGEQEEVMRKEYVDSTNTFYTYEENPTFASQRSERYFERDRPLLKYFYQTPANFYEISNEHFHLRANPIINFQYAVDSNDEQPIFLNLRGLEIRGGIDDRIYFYTNIHEQQARYPGYVNNYIDKNKAIPGAGLFKTYNSTIFNIQRGYDFTNAQALLGFNVTKHVGVQFGHGKNFIGNGYRSVLMSDFSTNYFYLKLNWRVGKFQLQNIFAETAGNSRASVSGDQLTPKKYIATHYLGFRPFEKLQIGLFESVVFHRENGFELQYLNPIILYRTVETYIGSPDNVLLGFDTKWNFAKGFQFYGQFLLDEFKFNELFLERNGWWANKYAGQLGIKAIDVAGIESLDLQAEYNFARPFMYTSRDSTLGNYAHYNQALAHPLGANFKEFVGIVKYRPFKNLYLEARYIRANFGEDPEGQNFGADINQTNITRTMLYGNETGQGIAAQTNLIGIDISYQLFHNAFIDFTFFQRTKDSENDDLDQTARYIGGGLRLNISKIRQDF